MMNPATRFMLHEEDIVVQVQKGGPGSGRYPKGSGRQDPPTTVHLAGTSVKLPGRYDSTKLPPHSLAVTTAHGYITLSRSSTEPDYLWVNHIRVSDEHQGKGEGSALFKRAAAEAVKQGYKGILRGDLPDRPASDKAQAVWAKLSKTSTMVDATGFTPHVLVSDDGEPSDDFRAREGTMASEMREAPLPATLQAAEDRIRYEPNEHVFILRAGKPVLVLGNDDPHQVRFDDTLDLTNATVTHNHPSGNGFSNQDGITAAKRNLVEMRAVTGAGTFVLHRTGTSWPAEFTEEIGAIHFEVMGDFNAKIKAGTLTIAEANAGHHRAVYERLQKAVGGFTYSFESK